MEARFERTRGAFTLSTDRARLDLDVVHAYLTRSYWAEGIPRDAVARSIEGALCFGLYEDAAQIGFARVITDRATYAYLADVFVLEAFRGQGLGVWMMEGVMAHPDLRGLRRWSLVTRDAHELYRRFGFTGLAAPDRYMEKMDPDVYRRD